MTTGHYDDYTKTDNIHEHMGVKSAVDVDHDVIPDYCKKPFIDGSQILIDGKIEKWTKDMEPVTSPIIDLKTGKRIVIGEIAKMDESAAVRAAEAAKKAWNNGQGEWPQMSMHDRIKKIEDLVEALKEKRSDIISCLMWEICKNKADAETEFDRTMLFIHGSIQAIKDIEAREGDYISVGGVFARYRRGAVGVMVGLSAYTPLFPLVVFP